MKKIILLVGFIAVFSYTFYKSPITVIAEDRIPENRCQFVDDVYGKVNCYADKYGVNRNLAHYIVKNESHYNPNDKGDMYIKCPAKRSQYYGKPVEARGLMQITKCYYPEVTDEQAYDPDFNLNFGMKLVSKGRNTCMSQFTTCYNYYH